MTTLTCAVALCSGASGRYCIDCQFSAVESMVAPSSLAGVGPTTVLICKPFTGNGNRSDTRLRQIRNCQHGCWTELGKILLAREIIHHELYVVLPLPQVGLESEID